jgi:hypothetical protein
LADLQGAANLLLHGDDLYVSAGFGAAGLGNVLKFDVATGAEDESFNDITGLAFPAGLALAPDGNGFLVSTLGFVDGTGQIDQYDFDGNLLMTFANNSDADPEMGFREATGLLFSLALLTGDTDGDGDVDLMDFDTLKANFGGGGTRADGDFNNDGLINLGDFNLLKENFGVSAVVPEPSTWVLVMTWGLGLIAFRFRLRSSGRR